MYLAFNHNDTVIAYSDEASDILAQAIEYHAQTGNSYHISNLDDLRPLCPKCNAVLSQAEDHLSAPDYFGACLDCDEDFYLSEIRSFKHREIENA